MLSLEDLFCSVDDFCQSFESQWQQQLLGFGLKQRYRPRSLSLSEIMTILIGFHQSCYRNFKTDDADSWEYRARSVCEALIVYVPESL